MKINAMNIWKSCRFSVQKNLPTIMIAGGCIGVVIGFVKACHDSLSVPEIVEEHQNRVEQVHSDHAEDSGSKEEKKELAAAYFETGVSFAKLYAVSVSIESLSLVCILAGSNKLRKRNVALAAACTELTNSFKNYRGRVVQRYGEKVDNELLYGITQETVEETVIDENGKKKKVKKTVDVLDEGSLSDYARCFGKGYSKAWEPNEDYNDLFLNAQERLFNVMLTTNKVVYLNDVLTHLGYEPTASGQFVGWILDEESEDRGDNYICLNIQKVKKKDESGEYETVWLINPNVDGPIIDRALKLNLIEK